MLQFILVAGYDNSVNENYSEYCMTRMRELIAEYAKKQDLNFKLFDYKEGTITNYEVKKGSTKPVSTVEKTFSPLEKTLRENKKADLANLISGFEVLKSIIEIGEKKPHQLMELSIFYPYDEGPKIKLLTYKKDGLFYEAYINPETDLSYPEMEEKQQESIAKAYHEKGYNWLWKYSGESESTLHTPQEDILETLVGQPVYMDGSFDNDPFDSIVPLNIFNNNAFSLIQKFLTVPRPYNFTERIGDTYIYKTEISKIDREKGLISPSFLMRLLSPPELQLTQTLAYYTRVETYSTFGISIVKKEKGQRYNLFTVDIKDSIRSFYENIYNTGSEHARNYFISYSGSDEFWGKGHVGTDYNGKYISKTVTESVRATFDIPPSPSTGYEFNETAILSELKKYVILQKANSNKNYYVFVSGIEYRQNVFPENPFLAIYLGRVYSNNELHWMMDKRVTQILNEQRSDIGLLIFIEFRIDLRIPVSNIYRFDTKRKKYIKFFTYYSNIISHPDSFNLEGIKYEYIRGVAGNQPYLVVYDGGIFIGRYYISKEFSDLMEEILAFNLYLFPLEWEPVSMEDDFKKGKATEDRQLLETTYVFDDKKNKSYRIMNLINIYLFISNIGRKYPGTLREFGFFALGDEFGPKLLNFQESLPAKYQENFEQPGSHLPVPGIFFEPGSERGIGILNSVAKDFFFAEAWHPETGISYAVSCDGDELYLKLIKSIIKSKEYKAGACTKDTLITLHSPGLQLRKFLNEQIRLIEDTSSTRLKIRYKLGDLLLFILDTIKSSYMYRLAMTSDKPVLGSLPGMDILYYDYMHVIRKKAETRYIRSGPLKEKCFAFYKRHFGLKRTNWTVFDPTDPDTGYVIDGFGSYVKYDPDLDSFKKTGIEGIKF